jgi:hypothetical protein
MSSNPARPNWDIYATWPSAYGSLDDLLFRSEERKGVRGKSLYTSYIHAEAEAWGAFARKGRYSILMDNATDRPNLAAGKLLGQLNAERIVAELKRLGTRFDPIKFAQALYCPIKTVPFKEFDNSSNFPEIRESLAVSGDYYLSIRARLAANFKLTDLKPYDPHQDQILEIAYGDIETHTRLFNMAKILRPFGIDIRNWSMVTNGGYDHEDGSGGLRGSSFAQVLDKPFLNTFFAHEDELIELVNKRRTLTKEVKYTLQEESAICAHFEKRRENSERSE